MRIRKVMLWVVASVCFVNVFAQQEVTSTTEKIQFFFHQAMVEKSATFNLKAGNNEIILKGHSPYLNSSSLIVEGESSFSISSFYSKYQPLVFVSESIEKRFNNEEKKKMKIWEDSIAILQESKNEVDFFLSVLAKEQQSLSNLNIFSPSSRRDSIPLWESSLAFYREKMLETEKLIRKQKKEQTELSKKIAKIVQHRTLILQKYNIGNLNENWVVVNIYADKAVSNAKLRYSYLVNNVSWRPIYDIEISSDNTTPEFVLKAEVTQNSQEDWHNVPLVFSTEAPAYSQYLGELSKYLLIPVATQPRLNSKQLGRQAVIEDNVEISFDFSADFITTENSMLGKTFTIKKTQTLLSGQPPQIIPLETRKEKAIYTYQAIPKLSSNAFLRAQIPTWEKLELIDAEGKIYLDSKFIANTLITSLSSSDTMMLDIGPNKRIVTEREVSRKTETRMGNKITMVTIEIDLKNNSSIQQAQLLLQDQIPISNIEEIKVLEYDVADGILNAETGIITWENIVLAPQASRKITISYSVKYPKNMSLFLD